MLEVSLFALGEHCHCKEVRTACGDFHTDFQVLISRFWFPETALFWCQETASLVLGCFFFRFKDAAPVGSTGSSWLGRRSRTLEIFS